MHNTLIFFATELVGKQASMEQTFGGGGGDVYRTGLISLHKFLSPPACIKRRADVTLTLFLGMKNVTSLLVAPLLPA